MKEDSATFVQISPEILRYFQMILWICSVKLVSVIMVPGRKNIFEWIYKITSSCSNLFAYQQNIPDRIRHLINKSLEDVPLSCRVPLRLMWEIYQMSNLIASEEIH